MAETFDSASIIVNEAFNNLEEKLDDYIQKASELYKDYSPREQEILIINAIRGLVVDKFNSTREKGLSGEQINEIRKKADHFIENYFKRIFRETGKIT